MVFAHYLEARLLFVPFARPFYRRGRIHLMLQSGNLLALSLTGTFV
ncbi:hypothetical protein HKBW3S03_01929, partial [Candidatus Hakubella thermalkaliphila]